MPPRSSPSQSALHAFWSQHWFLICLTVCIVAGLSVGGGIGPDDHQRVERAVGSYGPKLLVSFVLMLMSVTLATDDIKRALRVPGPAVWACLVNLGIMPLLAWPLALMQATEDLRLGILIAASVPSTMATASVWTRNAGGNDAVSLLVTAVTSGLCWLVTPFWLRILGGSVVDLDMPKLVVILLISALAPLIVGQILRQWNLIRMWVDVRKRGIGMTAQCCILTIVTWASFQGGPQFSEGRRAGVVAFLVVGACCIALHLAGMAIAVAGSRGAGFTRRDTIAVAFAASQKTLPIGILLAEAIGSPLALFPMLIYHAAQLFIDTSIGARFAEGSRKLQPAAAKDPVDQPHPQEARQQEDRDGDPDRSRAPPDDKR
jgi:sodium/bile acid cotransporter 7